MRRSEGSDAVPGFWVVLGPPLTGNRTFKSPSSPIPFSRASTPSTPTSFGRHDDLSSDVPSLERLSDHYVQDGISGYKVRRIRRDPERILLSRDRASKGSEASRQRETSCGGKLKSHRGNRIHGLILDPEHFTKKPGSSCKT